MENSPTALPLPEPRMLSELVTRLGGHLAGPDFLVHRLAPLNFAQTGDLTFFGDPRLAHFLPRLEGVGVLLRKSRDLPRVSQVLVPEPATAFFRLLAGLLPTSGKREGIHPTAVIASTAQLGRGVAIAAGVVVEDGARVGDGCILEAQVFVGEGCELGKDCHLQPGVKILAASHLGARVRVGAGAVIGTDGFGFYWEGQKHVPIPHLGRVVVGDDSSIGANTCIARSVFGTTELGSDVHLDNLIQIAHGVTVGNHVVMAAQTGIAGSASIGEGAALGGQVGVADHAEVGAGVRVAAQSGVSGHIGPGQVVAGTPAIPLVEWRKMVSRLARGR